ncbi:MAG: hypothetical protein U9O59_02580 [Actinomycetota bacterium]|nr:hypothetical protein [Actinomycetota bacterium]
MNVKEAVKKAIGYVADIFKSENATNIGLEEVIFDEHKSIWEVTVGFSRPWDYEISGPFLGFQQKQEHPKRQYKIVRIDNESGEIISIKIRETHNE